VSQGCLPVHVSSNTSHVDPHELELRRFIEAILSVAVGHKAKIDCFEREPSPFATLFPADVLTISLDGGDNISLFLKHLGSEEADHPDKQCRDREIRVYRELLTDGRLPVARYYGSRWNERSQRHEVVLEYIDGWILKYHHLEHWFTAARRLAHMHAHFSAQADKLWSCQYLLHFDARYYGDWAARALATVAEQSAELARALEDVLSQYHRAAALLAEQPRTLVHNDLAPKNVIVDTSDTPVRICIVDWEMSGVGCGLADLVHLKYGLDPLNDQKMCAAYCEELAGTNLIPSSPRELDSLIAACELYNTLHRLWRSNVWQLPIERVAQWVAEARAFMLRI
jgi:aminoglycoside phosphotransferase (APT) family kinase protein